MTGLAAPWWLLALAAVPLIRWLHRFSTPLHHARVSAIFLWHSAPSADTGGRSRQPPDPAWRRRALIAALLALALAQPFWRSSHIPVTLWIDDSPGMHSLEAGHPRLALALEELKSGTSTVPRPAGANSGTSTVPRPAGTNSGTSTVLRPAGDFRPTGTATVRSLSNPAFIRQWNEAGALDSNTWLRKDPGSPAPPPPGLLSPGKSHWLLTDGAHGDVVRWAESAPLAGIITVGQATENVAVTRLASRRSPAGPRHFDLLIEIANRGRHSATRNLVLTSGTAPVEARSLTLDAAETVTLFLQHRLGAEALTATLSPGDALALDDSLTLPSRAFDTPPVLIDRRCPPALRLAIATHPALTETAHGSPSALQLLCGDSAATDAPAQLRIHTDNAYPVRNALQWMPAAGDLQRIGLAREWMAATSWKALPDAEPLLMSGDEPLVIRRLDAPHHIETVLDLSRPDFVRQPEYAAFVAGLVDLALDRRLLDAITIATRAPADSDIAPSVPVARSMSPAGRLSSQQSLVTPLLLLALLLLLLDLFRVLQSQQAARHA
ncbi:MAG: BatA domain-containing protein [Woeseia sp.]